MFNQFIQFRAHKLTISGVSIRTLTAYAVVHPSDCNRKNQWCQTIERDGNT